MPDLGERVAILETQMKTIQESLSGLQTSVDGIKATVWKACGAITASIAVVEFLLRVRYG